MTATGDRHELATDRYTIISADCHAGGSHEQYREYLEAEWLDEFDAWRGEYTQPVPRPAGRRPRRNWDDERRIADLEADGQVAEVTFPNTVPPFFPTGVVIAARRPDAEDYRRRWAGLRAHNRWLADWCAQPPRRAAPASARSSSTTSTPRSPRCGGSHDHGLRGGVLIPGIPDDSDLPPYYSDHYDRLWAVCEELGVVVNHHTAGSGIPDYGKYPCVDGPVDDRDAVVRAPAVLAARDERCVRALPEPQARAHRAGLRLDPAAAAQLDGFHMQMAVGSHRRDEPEERHARSPLTPTRVLRAQRAGSA